MLCDICHKNIATVHLTEIINNKVAEMHICQGCAQTKAGELNQQPNISDFLSGLISPARTGKQEHSLKCPACGLNYSDFKKTGRLGCDRCYSAFRKQLLPLLKKIHSTTSHTGKIPIHLEVPLSAEAKLKELNRQLAKAVQVEEYEQAARIRDQIKKLEKKK